MLYNAVQVINIVSLQYCMVYVFFQLRFTVIGSIDRSRLNVQSAYSLRVKKPHGLENVLSHSHKSCVWVKFNQELQSNFVHCLIESYVCFATAVSCSIFTCSSTLYVLWIWTFRLSNHLISSFRLLPCLKTRDSCSTKPLQSLSNASIVFYIVFYSPGGSFSGREIYVWVVVCLGC